MTQAIQWQNLDEDEKKRLWMGAMDGGAAYASEAQMEALVATFNPFDVQFSGPEGWVVPDSLQLAWMGPGFDGYPAVPGIETGSLRALVLRCTLGPQQPAVVVPDPALHGLQSAAPALRLMLRPAWHDGFNCHHSAYQALAGLQLRRLALRWQHTALPQGNQLSIWRQVGAPPARP